MSRTVTYIKSSSLNKKMSQIMAAIVLLIVCLNVWLNVKVNGQHLLNENVHILAENILQQTSHNAREFMLKDDKESLQILADSAVKSTYIEEILVYDAQGVVMSQSMNAIPAKDRFFDNTDHELHKLKPTPFVKEITDNSGELLGFVRVTVLRQNLQTKGVSFLQSIMKQIMLVALLAGGIGYLLTTGMRPFSKNAYIIKE